MDCFRCSETIIEESFTDCGIVRTSMKVEETGRNDQFLDLIQSNKIDYEILGFLPNGGYIQKGFDYGCTPPRDNETYTPEKHFKIRVYRVTETNVDGKVLEYTTHQVQQWCQRVGLIPVEECFYGKAKDLYPDIDTAQHWNENFIERLANDKNFFMEQDSPHCKNKVPHEGLVIKIEDGLSRAFKLKCFRFLNKEQELLDKGEGNIEDEA